MLHPSKVRSMGASLAIGGAILEGCVVRTEYCVSGECSGAVSFISHEHPRPGSEASQTALRECEKRIDSTVRALAMGHMSIEPGVSPRVRTDPAGEFLRLLFPFYGSPIGAQVQRSWSPAEAEARNRARQEIGQCMEDRRRVFCQWHRDRTGLALGSRGPGWICRRRHLDDPDLP